MAKITIAGDSIVVTAGVTLATLKSLEKYRPKALYLYDYDDDGNRTEAFRVATGTNGIINGNGAVFASETHDDAKLATITMAIPAGTADAVEYAADKLGRALTMLNEVEAGIAEAVAEVEEEKRKVRELIQVVG